VGASPKKLFVGQMSTGASNDFERATASWRARMVTKYGMSDVLGTMVYADDKDAGFGVHNKTISEATQQKVDAEIRRILDEQYAVARIASWKRSATSSRPWPRPCWSGRPSMPSRSSAMMEGRTPSPPPGWVAKPPAGGGKDDSSTPTAPVLVDPAPQT
jgi:cell division protease FtsH